MAKNVKNVRRTGPSKRPPRNEFNSADNIRVSKGGKICLESFKKSVEKDGTITTWTKRIYKKPTKTNINKVKEAGYSVFAR